MASPHLFEFKAGRVELNRTTGEAKPLAGQGRVILSSSSEDPSLLGLQWFPRGSNNSLAASEELLLVPGDVEFSHVPECRTGRVLQMRFHSSGERHLFWLQSSPAGDLYELSTADKEIISKINELSNTYGIEEEESDDAEMPDEPTSEPAT